MQPIGQPEWILCMKKLKSGQAITNCSGQAITNCSGQAITNCSGQAITNCSGQAITNCESFVWNRPASCSVVGNHMGGHLFAICSKYRWWCSDWSCSADWQPTSFYCPSSFSNEWVTWPVHWKSVPLMYWHLSQAKCDPLPLTQVNEIYKPLPVRAQ